MLKRINKLSSSDTNSKNKIIHGDNIKVLKELKASYERKIRCVYIDPPYNNNESYNHYNDKNTHKKWLIELTRTLKYIKPLISIDGSIWISIDDNEVHYLKVAADNIFGRENFITTIVWQHRTTRENRKVFSNNHEYILVYAISTSVFKDNMNKLPQTSRILKRYKNPDKDPRGPWQSVSANVQAGHAVPSQFYEIVSPGGKKHYPPKGRCWVYNKKRMEKEIEQSNVWFGVNGNGVPRLKKFLKDRRKGVTPETLWLASDVSTTNQAKKHILSLFPQKSVFDTPKPEQLLKRIIEITTNKNDLVLDAYLGSGTTASTAHKMGRNYIGIEIGDHVIDYACARMNKVIQGEPGGISKCVNWKGGGSFEFLRLE